MYILMEVGSNSISESREGKFFSEVSSSVSDTEIAKGRDRKGQRTSFRSAKLEGPSGSFTLGLKSKEVRKHKA